MELYLTTYGTLLHKNADMFEIQIGADKKKISPQKVSSIIICNGMRLTSDAVKLAMDHNIDVLFLDEYGQPYGRIWFPKLGSTTFIRRKLLEHSISDAGTEIIKNWVTAKIRNQAALLTKLSAKRESVDLLSQIESMHEFCLAIEKMKGIPDELGASIMGYEGNAGKIYFQCLSTLIPDKYTFSGRSSHPAQDSFNAFLNYGYGILYGKVEKALVIAGLDPYIGFLHKDNYNKVSLVYDFIEPYRKLIDEPVFYLFSRHKVNDEHIDKLPDGVKLNQEGKKILVAVLMEFFDEIVHHGNKNMKRIHTIQADAHAFANFLINKKDDFEC